MDTYWTFKEGTQVAENKEEDMWLEFYIVAENEESLAVEFILHTCFREKKQYQKFLNIPKSKYTKVDFEGDTYYLLGHDYAYKLGITAYLRYEFAEKVLTSNLSQMKQKLKKELPVFDSRNAYENEVRNGNVLVTAKDANRLGFKVEEMDIAGYLLDEIKYVPLYDLTDKIIFYAKKPTNAEPLRVFNQFYLTPEEDDFIGYSFQCNSFTHRTIEPLYDLKKTLERNGQRKYKKGEYEKPFIETTTLPEHFVKEQADKIVGYRKGSTYYYPIIDVKKAVEASGLRYFDVENEDNIRLPRCTSKFFRENWNTFHDFDKDEYAKIGCYLTNENKLKSIYNVRKALKKIQELKKKRNELLVPMHDYEHFARNLPGNCQDYLTIEGLTTDDCFLVKGSNSKRWLGVVDKYEKTRA